MEDQILPYQQTQEIQSGNENSGSGKKAIVILGIVLFFIILGGGSFFLGRKSNSAKDEISPTPTQIPTSTPMPTISEPTPVSTISAIPTKKPTLTPKPSLTPTPILKTKILSSSAGIDGFRSSNGGGNNSLEIRAGRNVNLVTRGFVSFNLSEIPSGASVQEGTLRLYQSKVIGNPYTSGGALKVDHLTYGDSLDDADYGMAALISNIATLTTNSSIEWKDTDVEDEVKNDLANGRSKSQFRIHFTTENTGGDTAGDFSYFDSANSYSGNTGNKPQLVVKYY